MIYWVEKRLRRKTNIEIAVSEWKELESENNALEKEILEIGEKIAKNKVRQLEVKKNEEYQAQQNEISSLQIYKRVKKTDRSKF